MNNYSRRNYLNPGVDENGEVGRITGLNSFGQPFRGRKIRGVGAKERAVGMAYSRARTMGPPSQRKEYGSQGEFAAEKYAEHDRAAAEAARARGRALAEAEAARTGASTLQADKSVRAPEKKPGQLVPGNTPGSAMWKTDEEIAADEKKRAEARAVARKRRAMKGGGMMSGLGGSVRPVAAVPVENVA